MRHPFMYEGKSPVHKLYWFQYFLLDVLALYLLILYAVFKIVKFIVCKLCFKSSLKPKNDWAYIWKRLCDFIGNDISLSKNSIKLLESIHCMIISVIIWHGTNDQRVPKECAILNIEGHFRALLHSQIGQLRQPLLALLVVQEGNSKGCSYLHLPTYPAYICRYNLAKLLFGQSDYFSDR